MLYRKRFFSFNPTAEPRGENSNERGRGTVAKKQKTIKEYGSIKEWVNHEWLLPYLIIGGCRSDFWKLSPKTIQIDFDAYKERQRREAQDRWEIGAYVKCALNTSILVSTLAEKGTANKMPKFPEMPYKEQISQNLVDNDEAMLKAERLRTYCFLKTLGKYKKRGGDN